MLSYAHQVTKIKIFARRKNERIITSYSTAPLIARAASIEFFQKRAKVFNASTGASRGAKSFSDAQRPVRLRISVTPRSLYGNICILG